MELAVAQALSSALGAEALAAAAGETDPDSLGAAERMRARFPNHLAAAALTQEALRRRAVAKLGPRARRMLFTRDALEQATRGRVAAWRAARFAAVGADLLYDLGCGAGADALAFVAEGLRVVAVERDPATALLARRNLAGVAEVRCGDARAVDLPPEAAVYVDPARRDDRGRVWSLDRLEPPWSFVTSLLRRPVACAKVGPGIAHAAIPEGVLAEWVSDGGDVVECGLWRGLPAGMAATRLPDGARLVRDDTPAPEVSAPGRYLMEADGAALRAGCLPQLAAAAGAALICPGIAYLTSDRLPEPGWLTAFEIDEVLPYDEGPLRKWLSARRIGTVEIKKRGVEIDPAVLRRKLRPRGPERITLVVSPTPDGVRAFACRRVVA